MTKETRKNIVAGLMQESFEEALLESKKETEKRENAGSRMLLAHITNSQEDKTTIYQTLKEHSFNTAAYAKNSVAESLKKSAYFCGLIHDMGKAKREFQTYLTNSFADPESVVRGSVNHTYAAVIWILEQELPDNQVSRICAEILAFAVGAHHGLFDFSDFDGMFGLEKRLKYDRNQIHYAETVDSFYKEVLDYQVLSSHYKEAISELYAFMIKISGDCTSNYPITEGVKTTYFNISMICRMLLSAVIYGDRRDTIEFMQQKNEDYKKDNWHEACEFYENKIAMFNTDTALNQVRAEISKQCLKASNKACGIYRLNVPTGGGKTLSSFRYALHHAKQFNKKKIIYVIPYLTIIEQNAAVLKRFYLNPENILEHHSNAVNDSHKTDGELFNSELLATTWESQIVITTMVQFLEILFGHKTSSIGRMQAFNDSIVIFDEIQSIPRKSTYMFVQAINYLSHYCNCTAVLCSATQPSFETLQYPLFYANDADLVKLTPMQMVAFKRTRIVDNRVSHGMSIEELADFCQQIANNSNAVMCICNTKKEALKLYNMLNGLKTADVYHVSNAMCRAHINDVLNNVKNKLKNIQANEYARKLILVSTQIPEAGVDISFQTVIRVLAGLDNIQQADGRCNRSNEYGQGVTYIVNLNNQIEKTQYLPDIKYMQDATIKTLENKKINKDIMSEAASSLYFKTLFSYTKNVLGYPYKGTTLTSLLSNELPAKSTYKLTMPFKTIGQAYSVIDGATVDILVPYKPYIHAVNMLRHTLEHDKYNIKQIKSLIQELKGCTVSLYDYQVEKLRETGLLYPYLDETIFVLSENAYSEETGLKIPEKDNTELIL